VQCSAAQQRPALAPARVAAPLASAWQRPGTESLFASRRRLNHQCLASSAAGGSFDGSSDSEELDYSLTRELERVTQRDKYTKLASHLDLLYSVQEEVRDTPSGRVWAWEGVAGAARRPVSVVSARRPLRGAAPAPCPLLKNKVSLTRINLLIPLAAIQAGAVPVLPWHQRVRVQLVPRHRSANRRWCSRNRPLGC
jgi:hypothetical protein